MTATPPRLLLALWAVAVLTGGLRSDLAWLAWSGAFFLLLVWSPPDGPALARMNLWWAWLGWGLLSTLGSVEPVPSLAVVYRKATVILFFTIAWAWWGPKMRRAWVGTLLATAAVLGLAWLWGRSHGMPAGLLPPNPNYTGCFLAAAAGACVWLAGGAETKPRQLGWLLLAAGYAAVAVALRSRGAVFALAGSTALWAVFHKNWKAPLAAALAALAIFAASPAGTSSLLKLEDPLAYERPRLWKTAFDVANANPWLGVGPGCYERGYFRHRGPGPTGWTRFSRFATHAHSEPLQVAAETGWLGLGFLAWALAFFLPKRRPETPVSRAAAGAFWAILAHALVDGVLALPAIELTFFAALACASDVSVPPFRFGPPRWRWMGLAGAVLALQTWLPVRRASEWSRAAGEPRPTEDKVRRLKAALDVHPADSFLRDRLAAVYLTEAPPRPALALWQLQQALQANPANAVFWAQKAELLLRSGDAEGADEAAVRAASLEPNFVTAQVLVGEAALAQGQKPRAAAAAARVDALVESLRSVRPDSEYERLLLAVPRARLEALRRAAGAK